MNATARSAIVATVGAISVALFAAPASAAGSAATGLTLVGTVNGSGARVISVTLPAGPLLLKARNMGSSNFIVYLRGPGGKDLIFNEVGPFTGTGVSQNARGRHRFQVQAEGPWRIQVFKPTAAKVRPLVGSYQGKGSFAIPVRASTGELVVSARNAGSSNFIVYLVGFAGFTGRDLVFNEIGPYRGETIVDVQSGTMLLWVEAEGTWSLRFSR